MISKIIFSNTDRYQRKLNLVLNCQQLENYGSNNNSTRKQFLLKKLIPFFFIIEVLLLSQLLHQYFQLDKKLALEDHLIHQLRLN
jgi:hypothetical protein